MKVFPQGYAPKEPVISTLGIDEAKKAEMVSRANTLLGDTPKDFKVLCDELEHHYVFTCGEHYTSEQIKEVVETVRVQNQPVVKEVVETVRVQNQPVVKEVVEPVEPVEEPIELVEPK